MGFSSKFTGIWIKFDLNCSTVIGRSCHLHCMGVEPVLLLNRCLLGLINRRAMADHASVNIQNIFASGNLPYVSVSRAVSWSWLTPSHRKLRLKALSLAIKMYSSCIYINSFPNDYDWVVNLAAVTVGTVASATSKWEEWWKWICKKVQNVETESKIFSTPYSLLRKCCLAESDLTSFSPFCSQCLVRHWKLLVLFDSSVTSELWRPRRPSVRKWRRP